MSKIQRQQKVQITPLKGCQHILVFIHRSPRGLILMQVSVRPHGVLAAMLSAGERPLAYSDQRMAGVGLPRHIFAFPHQ